MKKNFLFINLFFMATSPVWIFPYYVYRVIYAYKRRNRGAYAIMWKQLKTELIFFSDYFKDDE